MRRPTLPTLIARPYEEGIETHLSDGLDGFFRVIRSLIARPYEEGIETGVFRQPDLDQGRRALIARPYEEGIETTDRGDELPSCASSLIARPYEEGIETTAST